MENLISTNSLRQSLLSTSRWLISFTSRIREITSIKGLRTRENSQGPCSTPSTRPSSWILKILSKWTSSCMTSTSSSKKIKSQTSTGLTITHPSKVVLNLIGRGAPWGSLLILRPLHSGILRHSKIFTSIGPSELLGKSRFSPIIQHLTWQAIQMLNLEDKDPRELLTQEDHQWMTWPESTRGLCSTLSKEARPTAKGSWVQPTNVNLSN